MRIPRRHPVTVLAAAGAALLFALAGPAAAHVTVHADNPTRGATDAVLSFRVPNEQDSAAVTRLEVELPTNPPLLGVLVRPHPGWTATVTTVPLNPPVQTDDGPVTQAVSRITWLAGSSAAAIPVGGYDDFDVAVGQLPTSSTLTFKAVQTYSNGQVARWIAPTAAGQPAPDDPAPILTLNPAGTAAPATGGASSAGASNGTSSSVPAATTVIDTSRDTTARVIAVGALVLALVGTVIGFLPGRRRRTGGQPSDSDPDGPEAPDRTHPSNRDSGAVPGKDAPGISASRTVAWMTQGWRDADQTARILLATAAFGALAVAVAAFLPWVDGTLSDRGAALLTVHKVGITNPLRGRWTLLLAAVALALIVILATRPTWSTRAVVLAAVGLGICAVALSGRHDGTSVARELIHHKIGTGEIVHPTAGYTTTYGWWITVAGGLTIMLAALGWFAHARIQRSAADHEPEAAHPAREMTASR